MHTQTTVGEALVLADETRPSMVPRVLGLLMVVLAVVGLMQSGAGLRAAPDFEAFLLLGRGVTKWQAFAFWSHLTGLVIGVLLGVAGVLAVRGHRRAPLLASVYAGAVILRVAVLVNIYYQTVAPSLKPFAKTALFGGHGVGVLLTAALSLVWAALVILLMNLSSSRQACSR